MDKVVLVMNSSDEQPEPLKLTVTFERALLPWLTEYGNAVLSGHAPAIRLERAASEIVRHYLYWQHNERSWLVRIGEMPPPLGDGAELSTVVVTIEHDVLPKLIEYADLVLPKDQISNRLERAASYP